MSSALPASFADPAIDAMTSDLEVALFTSDPTQADPTEVSGGEYSRQSVTFGSASGGSAANTDTVQFSGMPALGTAIYVGLVNASGDIWGCSTSVASGSIAGMYVQFSVGSLTPGNFQQD